MSKLKGSDLFLILAAVGVIGLLVYTMSRSREQRTASEEQPNAQMERSAPTSEEIQSRAIVWSDDPETLQEQLRNANRDQTMSFMRHVRVTGLPIDYEYPQFLLDAGSGKESARLIGERFPEFYGLGGEALITAARTYPVRYREMIHYSLAYREIYAHEVQHLRNEKDSKKDGGSEQTEKSPGTQATRPEKTRNR